MSELESEDLEIQEGARRLARQALLEGFDILENGRPGDKIALIKQLVTPMMRQLGADDSGGQAIDQMRQNFNRLMEEIRAKPVFTTSKPTVDRDQELRDDAPPTKLGSDGVPGSSRTAGERGSADPADRPEGTAVGPQHHHRGDHVLAIPDVRPLSGPGSRSRERVERASLPNDAHVLGELSVQAVVHPEVLEQKRDRVEGEWFLTEDRNGEEHEGWPFQDPI